jgi:hypothetical protein
MTDIFLYLTGGTVALPPRKDGCPWILGHGCTRWRHILWGSHSIWSDVIITSFPGMFSHIGMVWESKVWQSFIHLVTSTHGTISLSVSGRETLDISSLITAYNCRFRSLKAEGTEAPILHSILNLPLGSFENL